MRTRLALLVAGLVAGAGAAPAAESDELDPPRPLAGFGAVASGEQRALEARFDALLVAQNLGTWMEVLAARPHPVGSPHGKQNAHWLAAQFESWGYTTRLETFHVLVPTPRVRLVEMLEPERFTPRLVEPPVPGDRTSSQVAEILPPYHAYSADGDVTAPLVYVNYGLPEDYEHLARRGIDVRGKLVLARYGKSWRGIKPKVAAERGAVGCLVYSDPWDDGYRRGDVYPEGAWRNEHGAQRGSVADMPVHPGDPLTPGVGATKNAERLPRESAATITRIPVLPLSWSDAQPLLRALGGPVAPADWRGALPLTYHLGPGPAVVRLRVEFDWATVPAFDVIATLPGSERPDQWILRGNHHDAWVHGAHDPVSGLVALLEEARAVGELARAGWRPRRTIVYAAWDAEEPGLLGSTEWVEAHADALRERAVAYVNSDSNSRGFLSAGGSPTLERFLDEVARDVADPERPVSVAERLRAHELVDGSSETRGRALDRKHLELQPPGAGSDYTPFVHHLGVATLNLGFGGEAPLGGEYHSAYDSIDHYRRFGDPGFAYGLALARTAGRVMLRLAAAELLPFEFTALAEAAARYAGEVEDLAEDLRTETALRNRLIHEGRYAAAADPTETWVEPALRDPVPHFNFAPLRNALATLFESAERYAAAREAAGGGGERLTLDQRKAADRLLLQAERTLTHDEGLPGRPWYRHQLYAPGLYTGYSVKTLPAVRESIEERRWDQVDERIRNASETLERAAAHVARVAALLEGGAAAAGPTAPEGPR